MEPVSCPVCATILTFLLTVGMMRQAKLFTLTAAEVMYVLSGKRCDYFICAAMAACMMNQGKT
jgi:uncharacterized membrane protein